jgi:hypothetical protein
MFPIPPHEQAQTSTLIPSIKVVWSRRTDDTRLYGSSVITTAKRRHLAREIVWPSGAARYVGKFTSKKDAVAWINAHPRLTKPEDTMDKPHDADR